MSDVFACSSPDFVPCAKKEAFFGDRIESVDELSSLLLKYWVLFDWFVSHEHDDESLGWCKLVGYLVMFCLLVALTMVKPWATPL